MKLELFGDDGNYIPKPSEVRPIKEAHKIGNMTLSEYMMIDGEIKRIEWVLDVKNGILYPRERRNDGI